MQLLSLNEQIFLDQSSVAKHSMLMQSLILLVLRCKFGSRFFFRKVADGPLRDVGTISNAIHLSLIHLSPRFDAATASS